MPAVRRCGLVCDNFHGFDDHRIVGHVLVAVATAGRHGANFFQHFRAFNYLAEYGVAPALHVLAGVVQEGEGGKAAEPIEALLAKADLTRYRIQLETQGLEEPVTVLGDREQLQLVVHNLIRNAIEATGADGHLRLALHRQAKAVELEVADDGPGFPQGPVDLDGLLMASTKSEGMGIGLYVVRCAVDNHNGSLEIGRSDLGGASVRLRFQWKTGGMIQSVRSSSELV